MRTDGILEQIVPDDEVVGEIKPSVYAGLRALGYCSLQRLLQQIFNEI